MQVTLKIMLTLLLLPLNRKFVQRYLKLFLFPKISHFCKKKTFSTFALAFRFPKCIANARYEPFTTPSAFGSVVCDGDPVSLFKAFEAP